MISARCAAAAPRAVPAICAAMSPLERPAQAGTSTAVFVAAGSRVERSPQRNPPRSGSTCARARSAYAHILNPARRRRPERMTTFSRSLACKSWVARHVLAPAPHDELPPNGVELGMERARAGCDLVCDGPLHTCSRARDHRGSIMTILRRATLAVVLAAVESGCESTFGSSASEDKTADANSDTLILEDATPEGGGGSNMGVESGTGGTNVTDASSDPDVANDGATRGDEDAAADQQNPIDARTRVCSPIGKFGEPTPVSGSVNSVDDELSPRLSVDERTIYFGLRTANDPAAPTHLYVANRGTPTSPFEAGVALAVNSTGSDADPMIGMDGLNLFFSSDRANGSGEIDLYWSSRSNTIGPFISVAPVPAVNSMGSEVQPFFSSDGEHWFAWRRMGIDSAFHLRRAPRAGAGFAAPLPVNELDSATDDMWPVLTNDRLTIYFSSSRTDGGALGKSDVWMARRSSPTATFDRPTNVAELNSTQTDHMGWISPDNCRLYLSSNRASSRGYEIFVATR
jgi:hypothetical protein